MEKEIDFGSLYTKLDDAKNAILPFKNRIVEMSKATMEASESIIQQIESLQEELSSVMDKMERSQKYPEEKTVSSPKLLQDKKKRAGSPKPLQKKKKRAGNGECWTEHEQRLFKQSLRKHGKGNWKRIALDIETRTSIQVASHAQKYYLNLEREKSLYQDSTFRLYGSPRCSHTAYIRFALHHKGILFEYVPTISDQPLIKFGTDNIQGSRGSLLHYIEGRFPDPPLSNDDEVKPWVVTLMELQHRSIVWHVKSLMRCVDLEVENFENFSNRFSLLMELMIQHEQMEEKVLFPIINNDGILKALREQHASYLPIMNGIKAAIKAAGVDGYLEGFSNVSKCFECVLKHCEEHFWEEERKLVCYMVAGELGNPKQVLERCFDAMQGTHEHVYFLLEGLLPFQAMRYLDLITAIGKAR